MPQKARLYNWDSLTREDHRHLIEDRDADFRDD